MTVKHFFAGVLALGVFGCASTSEPPQATSSNVAEALGPWSLGQNANALYAASCPNRSIFIPPETIELSAKEVELFNLNRVEAEAIENLTGAKLDGVEFVAGYHLTSDDPRFGGLSGLASLENGDLLSVSDTGAFVWIEMDEFTQTQPVGAKLSDLKNADGSPLTGKIAADSEGVTLADGLAIVSFEREHRVAAFDLVTCGAAARAAPVYSLEKTRDGLDVLDDNAGMESIAITDTGRLILGVEAEADDTVQISLAPADVLADFSTRPKTQKGFSLTGLDYLPKGPAGGELFAVFRHFSPLTGPRAYVKKYSVYKSGDNFELGEGKLLLSLRRPSAVDNFEGIAVRRTQDGVVRLYLVSDDNFSRNQRSLLFVFNVLQILN